ncbi:hypothetical protein ACETK8_18035 [Brevundimonas staleyi]|uniref:Uncharacterized protein n=1 Tax=Brevundimonas staleyi TaxID=74326 RepID=A0ABW0FU31_9CAUL
MSRFDRDSTYLIVRRWIDHDIAHRYRAPSVQVSGLLTGLLVMILLLAEGWLLRLAIFPLLLVSSAWTGFVFWRVSRITRALTIKGDRQYDQKGKFMLPPEYANSESTTAAERRKRRRSRR